MKRYLFSYQTITTFGTSATDHHFKLRAVPCNNFCQNIVRLNFSLYPNIVHSEDVDCWGNNLQYGSCLKEHDHFIFTSGGVAELQPYSIPTTEDVAIFRLATTLTTSSPQMKLLSDDLKEEATPLEKAIVLSQKVHSLMCYTPGLTHTTTTAIEAFDSRCGVCQDYAHILIALCRNCNIAARYVNGFMSGYGQTHGWVEVYDSGVWRGLDPTNNELIEYGYIKVAHGRDASDCSVNRGIFRGGGTCKNQIRVIVEEL